MTKQTEKLTINYDDTSVEDFLKDAAAYSVELLNQCYTLCKVSVMLNLYTNLTIGGINYKIDKEVDPPKCSVTYDLEYDFKTPLADLSSSNQSPRVKMFLDEWANAIIASNENLSEKDKTWSIDFSNVMDYINDQAE